MFIPRLFSGGGYFLSKNRQRKFELFVLCTGNVCLRTYKLRDKIIKIRNLSCDPKRNFTENVDFI